MVGAMKVLVVHGSRSGWTERIARMCGDVLAGDGHEVEVAAAADDPNPAGRDATLVLGGVRAMQWHPDAGIWVQEHADELRAQRFGIATVCLSPHNAHMVVEKLLAGAQLKPDARVELAGGYDPERVNRAERMVMMAMNQKPVDAIDATAVAAFARATVGRP